MKSSSSTSALLIDGNAMIHRAWHALPPLTAPSGQVVNAVYGFTSILLKVLESERPDYFVVCWDTPEPTYRHVAEPAYKAQRIDQPKEFYDQFDLVKELVSLMGGRNLELPGYEADDLLATTARQLAEHSVEVTVLTSDRDVWQIIKPHIRVMSFQKGVSDTLIYDDKNFFEIVGMQPKQIIDYKALSGDSSDNLKGVPGIGEKTALELLQKFSTVDGIFDAAKDPSSDIKPGARQKLLEGEKAGRETLKLVRLMDDAPIKEKMESYKRETVDEEKLKEFFQRMGFKTLLARALGGKGRADERRQTRDESSGATKEGKKLSANRSMFESQETSEAEGSGERASKGSSKKAANVTSVAEVDAAQLLNSLKSGDVLFVRPIEVAQESLFEDAPALVLGTMEANALVTRTQLAEKKLNTLLKAKLANSSIQKVGQDLKLTWHWCRAHEFTFEGLAFDLSIAAYIISAGERRYDLATLAMSRLNLVVPEDEVQPMVEMNAIRSLYVELSKELVEQRLASVFTRFELPLIPVLGEMEQEGILIDRSYFKGLHTEFLKTKSKLEEEMMELATEQFNPGSPSQLAHILFEVLKLPSKGIKRGKTGFSTAATELEKLEGAHPIIEKISEYREVAKLLSTYIDALPELVDAHGRIHTTYNQTIAATGRLSSIDPNLQNIPIRTELGRRIRRGFVAKKGFVLFSCDYSQIELRIVAALAKDEKMLEAFRKHLDIHTATAAAMWNVDLDKITKDQRRAAKAINFGLLYGQGPHALSKSAGVPFEEARHFIEEYFHVYSGIKEYLEQTKALARVQGYVETLFGRRRPLPDMLSPMQQLRAAAERMAINMPVQGTNADIIKLAMIDIAKKLPSLSANARMLLQVHDELVFEVPEEEVETLAPKLADLMQNIEKIGCPIVVESKVGKNWDEMTKI